MTISMYLAKLSEKKYFIYNRIILYIKKLSDNRCDIFFIILI